ncbi:DNA-(apurinic or apyrimidinic site) lyase/DNA-formamidopyrimidine glycosylase [Acididesulfobacillus acetoxydans]|uniref:Formamidopyrimidine-DNA glycosylase n=1 Tax=Acididesulfobacillus acetoxydans TaxID=1561005 RepID=A0A8S0VXS2_9FIRM|nr:bifunctional DNA-formamidopyrimidine glycosylase/DNA-(apurinic or apyrimidinic site) lyase [Acididesulfobacillus acetoxydans]CAA7602233.1 DNA-(apurinic or apyrimidinic site) lyase/DNA-formamidopyrimidine glycosylase [Acididesulfobacillus acetoxydans]CEJ07549.1 Formamidopyrimidine-DNA glycosylase [Acididesulfobacillus acetoxydans]
MPELPEVETIRRTLAGHLTDARVTGVRLIWPGAFQGWGELDFAGILTGKRIQGLERRGKYLLIHLDEGWSLVAHMRMTGRLLYFSASQEIGPHTRGVFELNQGELHFQDVRKFGRILAVPSAAVNEVRGLAALGPEPLEQEFTPDVLRNRLRGKKTCLKSALLDQRVLAGLGNIYTDEALFRARLSPERPAASLEREEAEKLTAAIKEVLKAGIEAQGTSFRDYRDANGRKGEFQRSLQVYGRQGQLCTACGGILVSKRLGGRTAVFCPACQV